MAKLIDRSLRTHPLELRLRPREEVQKALMQQANASFSSNSKKLRTNRLYGELGEGGQPSVKVEQTKGPKAVEPPSPKEPWMQLFVTEVVECGHFWAHRAEAEYFDQLALLMETINQDGGASLQPLPAHMILRDQYCLAPYQDEASVKYYRARIVAAFPDHVKAVRHKAPAYMTQMFKWLSLPVLRVRTRTATKQLYGFDPHMLDTPKAHVESFKGSLQYQGPVLWNCLAADQRKHQHLKRKTDCRLVFYLDYGNMETVLKSCLCEIPPELLEIPFQSMECYLKGIRPSFARSPEGKWDRQATLRFHELVADKILLGKVFSVVRGALRLDLYRTTKHDEIFINNQLVQEHLADQCEESYASRKSHEERADQSLSPEDSSHLWAPADSGVENNGPEDNFSLRGRNTVRLHGPYSPYEMVFHSMINIGRLSPYEMVFHSMINIGRLRSVRIERDSVNSEQPSPSSALHTVPQSVRIERDSVNSVALNARPQDTHQRMLVAGHVGVNPTGSTITARDTTLMPNMPGLAALVCLMFTPVAELRTNRSNTHYIGAICGLGCDPETGIGVLPDHDLEITFDTHFKQDYLHAVNRVRMAINLALGSENNIAAWGPSGITRIQEKARRHLLNLMQIKPDPIEPQMFHKPYWWNQVNPEDVLLPGLEDTSSDCPHLLNLHRGIFLVEEVEEETDRKKEDDDTWKRKHMMELREKAYKSNEAQLVQCKVCNVEVNTPRELLLHLSNRQHRAEEINLFGM
ncbi:ATP-dependent RNA helicase tdrd9 [Branchiostoma belcheri]|nr:ATP-dependent RNA helicase tdrd9 [Branchiostoma belcheri]